MEVLDIYNKDKTVTEKTIIRGQGTVEDGEYILTVQIWIINSKGEIFISQRSYNKVNGGGGLWEIPGGCVVAGETSEDGKNREIMEEVGIDIKKSNSKLAKTLYTYKGGVNAIRDLWIVRKDFNISDVTFNDGEAQDAKFVTKKEFIKMINEGIITEASANNFYLLCDMFL